MRKGSHPSRTLARVINAISWRLDIVRLKRRQKRIKGYVDIRPDGKVIPLQPHRLRHPNRVTPKPRKRKRN